MKDETIRAVEMVRRIRDEMYEETKDLSADELLRFFAERSQGAHQRAARRRDATLAAPVKQR